MAKYYRKKAVDAEQFDPQGTWPKEIIKWEGRNVPRDMSWGYIMRGTEKVHVHAGDWIVREGGWVLVHRAADFERDYEPVPVTQNRSDADTEEEEEDGGDTGGNHPGKPGNP